MNNAYKSLNFPESSSSRKIIPSSGIIPKKALFKAVYDMKDSLTPTSSKMMMRTTLLSMVIPIVQ